MQARNSFIKMLGLWERCTMARMTEEEARALDDLLFRIIFTQRRGERKVKKEKESADFRDNLCFSADRKNLHSVSSRMPVNGIISFIW